MTCPRCTPPLPFNSFIHVYSLQDLHELITWSFSNNPDGSGFAFMLWPHPKKVCFRRVALTEPLFCCKSRSSCEANNCSTIYKADVSENAVKQTSIHTLLGSVCVCVFNKAVWFSFLVSLSNGFFDCMYLRAGDAQLCLLLELGNFNVMYH